MCRLRFGIMNYNLILDTMCARIIIDNYPDDLQDSALIAVLVFGLND